MRQIKSSKTKVWITAGILVAAGLLVLVAGLVWYFDALKPVNPQDSSNVNLTVKTGASADSVAEELKDNKLIKSKFAFEFYNKLNSSKSTIQVGVYKLSPTMSVSQIYERVTSGQSDELTITFYPGATLYDPTDIADNKRTDVFTILKRAGFSESEIKAGLEQKYDHPLLVDKPESASLEGYVYGETYKFAADVTVSEILNHVFDVYYQQLKSNDIIAGAKKQGLNLHQAITLASIIQREVSSEGDQKQVAQVFYSRLKKDMPLGSDVTFIYAADQDNMPRAVDYPSAYNTRINKNLPPGPIAAPGLKALIAVASPSKGDYLYFVAGDDQKTYFSKTNQEHEKNTKLHCIDLCKEV